MQSFQIEGSVFIRMALRGETFSTSFVVTKCSHLHMERWAIHMLAVKLSTLINLFCFAVNVQLKQMLQTNSELDYATNIIVVKVGHRQLFITRLPLVTIAEPPYRRVSIPTNIEETEYP